MSENTTSIQNNPAIKPPLGLKPRFIVYEQRLEEINKVISEYLLTEFSIPMEWLEERNDIVEFLKNRNKS